jgi:hypothetical protein
MTVFSDLGRSWLANPCFNKQREQSPFASAGMATPHSRQEKGCVGGASMCPLKGFRFLLHKATKDAEISRVLPRAGSQHFEQALAQLDPLN